jgi:two-component system, LytTR family, sensor histidine kinase AlgZ
MRQDAGESRRQNGPATLAPAWLPAGSPRLPDFCNLGTWLRVLLAVNGMALAAAFMRARGFSSLPIDFASLAAVVEPVSLGSLLLLCTGRRWLGRLPARAAAAVAVLVTFLVGSLFAALLTPLGFGESQSWWYAGFWSALTVAVLIAWFDLAARAHAPAVTEARLMALTARIRPHFLFNSLNAVLGVIRSDPRRAEQALEELAELFRALMQDNRDLVTLSDEISLARQYLDLERLRLGDRLRVKWDVESCPPDALVPPLMLQPLIENAVYHGIEPLGEAGVIEIHLACPQGRVLIEIANPCQAAGSHQSGNRMALDNIRERLLLFFDLEASLQSEITGDRYRVRIQLPYRRGGAA